MITKTMEQVLIGSILGDGSINKYGAYSEGHCFRQKDYLLWKKKIFNKQFKESTLNYYENIHNHRKYSLYIPKQTIFKKYRKLCYPNGKKIVSNKFIKRIGKLAIVVWYFDDGNYNPMMNTISIFSMGFSYEENQKLQRMLKDRFNLNFRISHENRGDLYFLRCFGKDTDNFLDFIKKNVIFIPKNLIYKLGKFDKRNSKWIESAQELKKKMDKEYYNQNSKKIKNQANEYYWDNRKERRKKQSEYYLNNKEKFGAYREKNRKYYLEYNRKYRKENKEYFIIWYKKNRKKNRKKRKEYYLNNKEKIAEYRKKNKEMLQKYFREYKEKHREYYRKYRRRYYLKNRK